MRASMEIWIKKKEEKKLPNCFVISLPPCARACVWVSVVFSCKRKTKRKAEQQQQQRQQECVKRAASGKMPATANSWVLLLLFVVAVERCSSSSSNKEQWQEPQLQLQQQESSTLLPLPDKGTSAISLWPSASLSLFSLNRYSCLSCCVFLSLSSSLSHLNCC